MKQLLTSIAIVIASISFSQESESELVTDILYTAATISKEDAINYIETTFEWERIETNDSCVIFKMEHGDIYVCENWVSLFFESKEIYSSLWLELFEIYGAPTKEQTEVGDLWDNFGNWFALYTFSANEYMLSLDRYILPIEE